MHNFSVSNSTLFANNNKVAFGPSERAEEEKEKSLFLLLPINVLFIHLPPSLTRGPLCGLRSLAYSKNDWLSCGAKQKKSGPSFSLSLDLLLLILSLSPLSLFSLVTIVISFLYLPLFFLFFFLLSFLFISFSSFLPLPLFNPTPFLYFFISCC